MPPEYSCPDDVKFVQLASGKLLGEEARLFAAHLDQCSSCAARMNAVTVDNVSVPGGEVQEAETAPLRADADRLKKPRTGLEKPPPSRPVDEAAGAMIGPYQLVQPLGKGGMGMVWLAEQKMPVRRQVALKIIKENLEGDRVLARFEAERQALAMMDHPNIARVFDAGATANGRPYFVMELVNGSPFSVYCDDNKLTLQERFDLFIPVCQAVQHAHQKGIVHRDLKPSNVLVGLYNDKPMPKVIDFGVAKATQEKLTEGTLTEVGQIVGTAEYMSPEQADLQNVDVDTRADIYSLGVMLYEQLTGTRPFTSQELRGAGIFEMLRLIREVEPARPGARLAAADNLPALAEKRSIESKKLARLVRGDLDWIVMKCLEKERSRRYETASQLGDELKRFMADEPVLAGPPSLGYRARKFLRRNKTMVVAAALVLLTLIGGIVGTTIGLIQAEQAHAAEAEANGKLRQKTTDLETANLEIAATLKLRSEQRNLSMRTLGAVIDKVSNKLTDVPGTRKVREELTVTLLDFVKDLERTVDNSQALDYNAIRLRLDLARMFGSLRGAGIDEGHKQVQIAHELARQWAAAAPHDRQAQRSLAMTLEDLGDFSQSQHKVAEAIGFHKRALEIRKQLVEADAGDAEVWYEYSNSHMHMGRMLHKLGQTDAAAEHVEQALAIRKKMSDADPSSLDLERKLSVAHEVLGQIYWTRRHTDARKHLQRNLEICKKLLEAEPDNPKALFYLADAYGNMGLFTRFFLLDRAEAVKMHEAQLGLLVKLTDADPSNMDHQMRLAHVCSKLGDLYLGNGQTAGAHELFKKHLAICERQEDKYPLCDAYERLGQFNLNEGRLGVARDFFEKSLVLRKKILQIDPKNQGNLWSLADAYGYLGDVCFTLQRLEEALDMYAQSHALCQQHADAAPGDKDAQRNVCAACYKLAQTSAELGKTAQATKLFARQVDRLKQAAGAQPDSVLAQSDLAYAHSRIGSMLLDQCDLDQATQHLEAARAGVKRMRAAGKLQGPIMNEAFARWLEYRFAMAEDLHKTVADVNYAFKKGPAETRLLLLWRARELARRKKLAEAADSADRLAQFKAADDPLGQALFYAALARGAVAAAAEDKDEHVAAAVEFLLEAQKRGGCYYFRRRLWLRHHDDFAVLRQHPKFVRILAQVDDKASTVVLKTDGELRATDPRDRVLKKSPHHVYDVVLKAGLHYTFALDTTLDGPGKFDPELRLEDDNGKELGRNDDADEDTQNSFLFFSPRKAGTYRVIATSHNGRPGPYVLTVRQYQAP